MQLIHAVRGVAPALPQTCAVLKISSLLRELIIAMIDLILHGDADENSDYAASVRIASQVPGAKLRRDPKLALEHGLRKDEVDRSAMAGTGCRFSSSSIVLEESSYVTDDGAMQSPGDIQ